MKTSIGKSNLIEYDSYDDWQSQSSLSLSNVLFLLLVWAVAFEKTSRKKKITSRHVWNKPRLLILGSNVAIVLERKPSWQRIVLSNASNNGLLKRYLKLLQYCNKSHVNNAIIYLFSCVRHVYITSEKLKAIWLVNRAIGCVTGIRVDSGNQSYDVFFTSVITYIRKHSKQTNWNHHVFSNYISRVKTRVLQ